MRRILSGRSGNKGVTLITLIIAITIFAVFITVFSYVMIAKHGSEALYVQSTQAYAIAQAGIEYGIRYATDNSSWVPTLNTPVTLEKNFGDGTFSLTYSAANGPDDLGTDAPSKLTSTGTVGIAERKIILQRFAGVVAGQAITLDPSDLPYTSS
ncbi:MAG: hypothetical protein L6406_00070 [Desulfobacterales bacterium]|nr:hypothetical protein [Pseudomonadota bacterium]MCG2774050.1 hypothetical protein [Desulfobacterales bacterium]